MDINFSSRIILQCIVLRTIHAFIKQNFSLLLKKKYFLKIRRFMVYAKQEKASNQLKNKYCITYSEKLGYDNTIKYTLLFINMI